MAQEGGCAGGNTGVSFTLLFTWCQNVHRAYVSYNEEMFKLKCPLQTENFVRKLTLNLKKHCSMKIRVFFPLHRLLPIDFWNVCIFKNYFASKLKWPAMTLNFL